MYCRIMYCIKASRFLGSAFLVFLRHFAVGGQALIEDKDEFVGT